MATSSITLAELLYGAEKSNAPSRSLMVVEDFCSRQLGADTVLDTLGRIEHGVFA